MGEALWNEFFSCSIFCPVMSENKNNILTKFLKMKHPTFICFDTKDALSSLLIITRGYIKWILCSSMVLSLKLSNCKVLQISIGGLMLNVYLQIYLHWQSISSIPYLLRSMYPIPFVVIKGWVFLPLSREIYLLRPMMLSFIPYHILLNLLVLHMKGFSCLWRF